MSCSRFQYDLSRCLDGRLPGARRAEVMAHVDKCPRCTQVWEEMQAAQSLVFRLEAPQVTPNFRDEVWDRIHSGEGSSEILLQEPITTLTKLRYGLVGAAAAAAFLFGVHLLTTESSSDPNENVEIAKASDTAPKSGQPELVVKVDPPVTPQLVADDLAAAGHVATQTIAKVNEAANRLKIRKPAILSGKSNDQTLWQEVSKDVETIDGGLHVLNTLQNKNLVALEPSSQACMTAARVTLKAYRSDSRLQTLNLVRTLDDCSLDGLTRVRIQFSIPQFQQPNGMLFGMFADDPMLPEILMRLGIMKSQGSVLMLPGIQFAPGATQHNLVFRFQQQTQPNAAPPRKSLRKRSEKR